MFCGYFFAPELEDLFDRPVDLLKTVSVEGDQFVEPLLESFLHCCSAAMTVNRSFW
jgi:hypothetical protein